MELTAQKREELGKENRFLKREGKLPCVIFGKGMDSVSIVVEYVDFVKTFKEAGETNLIDIKVGSKNYKVLIKNVQLDPVTDKFIHVEFYKPDLLQKTSAQVPVVIVGREESEFLKGDEVMLITLMQEITVEALPEDLPHEFTVDVTNLNEIGQGITVQQLKYDRDKVEIPDLDPEDFIVRVDEVNIEEEPEEEVSEEEALEALEATEETAEEETEEGEERKEESSEEKTEE